MPATSANTTVVGVFPSARDAQAAVGALREAGIPAGDISIIANAQSADDLKSGDIAGDVAADVGIGTALGAIGGLLLGLTAIVIPGIGPVMAAGPLLAALGGAGIGALAGGLIGALNEAGVSEEEARGYAEHVRRGKVLVTVRTAESEAGRVRDILDHAGAMEAGDPAPVEDSPATSDVVGLDPGAEPESADEVRREYIHRQLRQEPFDIEQSLVRPEVLEAEEDPVGMAQRSSHASVRARIYQSHRHE